MSDRNAGGGAGLAFGVTPLWAVLAFTFLNSLGTGLVTSGVTFITTQGLGFSRWANLGLAVGIGLTYIVGAAYAGRWTRWLRGTLGLSARGVLVWLMLALAALACLPYGAQRTFGGPVPPSWSMWVMVLVYSPLTGLLWPVVESFLSGGRQGNRLRSALGVWNVVWSGALVVAYWAVAPVIKPEPGLALVGLGMVHVVALVVLAAHPAEPARHVHDNAHGPVPTSYPGLLAIFRILLPTSYVVNSALTPILPELLGRYPIDAAWQVRLATAWLVARPITFWILERWQGWRGSRAMPIAGALLLVIGFAGSVAASRIDTGNLGLAIQVGSLALFGMGMATIYTGAIYYAMAVGSAEVDAGGTHEALIGVGYTLGPLCGVFAAATVASGVAAEGAFEAIVIGCVSVAGVAGLIWGLRQAIGRR